MVQEVLARPSVVFARCVQPMNSAVGEIWVPFEGTVATSHRVAKYGGVSLADSALVQIVDALNQGRLPMIANHDWTRPVRTKELEAKLVILEDGERAVRLRGLAVRGDWDAAGLIGGMSFSCFEALGRAEGPHPESPPLSLSADAGWFDDEAIAAASSVMCVLAPAKGARLLQFAAIDIARVILEIGYDLVLLLGPGLATSAVWDGLKHLLARRNSRPDMADESTTRIELVTSLPTGDVTGIIDTSDPAIVSQALAAYSSAVLSAMAVAEPTRQLLVWRTGEAGSEWVRPS